MLWPWTALASPALLPCEAEVGVNADGLHPLQLNHTRGSAVGRRSLCLTPYNMVLTLSSPLLYSHVRRQISDATSSVGTALIELRRIEAMREIANTLSRSRNVVYLPSGNNMLLGLNPGLGARD